MAELLKKAESPIKEEIVPTKEEVLVTSAHVEDKLLMFKKTKSNLKI